MVLIVMGEPFGSTLSQFDYLDGPIWLIIMAFIEPRFTTGLTYLSLIWHYVYYCDWFLKPLADYGRLFCG